jgi:hypothetical protein
MAKREQTGDQPDEVLHAIETTEMIDLLKCSVT